MQENRISDLIKSSLDGIRDFCDVDTVFGKAVTTQGGVTVIPISKISLGFASGGVDIPAEKRLLSPTFGTGSGTGVSVTPIGFLTVGGSGEINLLEIGKSSQSGLLKALSLIEDSPDIIRRIKSVLEE